MLPCQVVCNLLPPVLDCILSFLCGQFHFSGGSHGHFRKQGSFFCIQKFFQVRNGFPFIYGHASVSVKIHLLSFQLHFPVCHDVKPSAPFHADARQVVQKHLFLQRHDSHVAPAQAHLHPVFRGQAFVQRIGFFTSFSAPDALHRQGAFFFVPFEIQGDAGPCLRHHVHQIPSGRNPGPRIAGLSGSSAVDVSLHIFYILTVFYYNLISITKNCKHIGNKNVLSLISDFHGKGYAFTPWKISTIFKFSFF